MEASDIKKSKDLDDESRRLKQMFADLSLENRALKTLSKKTKYPLMTKMYNELKYL